MYVAYIFAEQSVVKGSERTVIEVEIILLYDAGIVVLWIIAPPFPVER